MVDDYKVGKGRPPKHAQFQKGQSGNPRGRPKKNPSLLELEAKLLFRDKHALRENGEAKKYNIATAALKLLAANAMKGNQRAIEQLLKRVDAASAALKQQEDRIDPGAARAQLIQEALMNTFVYHQDEEEEASS